MGYVDLWRCSVVSHIDDALKILSQVLKDKDVWLLDRAPTGVSGDIPPSNSFIPVQTWSPLDSEFPLDSELKIRAGSCAGVREASECWGPSRTTCSRIRRSHAKPGSGEGTMRAGGSRESKCRPLYEARLIMDPSI